MCVYTRTHTNRPCVRSTGSVPDSKLETEILCIFAISAVHTLFGSFSSDSLAPAMQQKRLILIVAVGLLLWGVVLFAAQRGFSSSSSDDMVVRQLKQERVALERELESLRSVRTAAFVCVFLILMYRSVKAPVVRTLVAHKRSRPSDAICRSRTMHTKKSTSRSSNNHLRNKSRLVQRHPQRRPHQRPSSNPPRSRLL